MPMHVMKMTMIVMCLNVKAMDSYAPEHSSPPPPPPPNDDPGEDANANSGDQQPNEPGQPWYMERLWK